MKSTYGFSLDSKSDRRGISNFARTEHTKYSGGPHKLEIKGSNLGIYQLSEGNLKESLKPTDCGLLDSRPTVVDSLELIDQDYVIVTGPPIGLPPSAHSSKTSHFSSQSGSSPLYSGNVNPTPSAPVPIIGGAPDRVNYSGSLASRLSAPGISQGSLDIEDTLEQPSTDYITRISSLQRYAATITDLVNDKIKGGNQLEAFSVQLVILAIWKQALHICHTHAASATEGSPSEEVTRFGEVCNVQDSPDASPDKQLDICSKIERAFLQEVGLAEELAKVLDPGNEEMPDALELLYQSALALGRYGAVDEYMGDIDNAVVSYSKAARLLLFLLMEAPSLILNPPFSLTNSDRYRIKNYIDVLNNRQSVSRSQRMAVFRG